MDCDIASVVSGNFVLFEGVLVFFVEDDQPKLLEPDVLGEQPVGTNQNIDLAF